MPKTIKGWRLSQIKHLPGCYHLIVEQNGKDRPACGNRATLIGDLLPDKPDLCLCMVCLTAERKLLRQTPAEES